MSLYNSKLDNENIQKDERTTNIVESTEQLQENQASKPEYCITEYEYFSICLPPFTLSSDAAEQFTESESSLITRESNITNKSNVVLTNEVEMNDNKCCQYEYGSENLIESLQQLEEQMIKEENLFSSELEKAANLEMSNVKEKEAKENDENNDYDLQKTKQYNVTTEYKIDNNREDEQRGSSTKINRITDNKVANSSLSLEDKTEEMQSERECSTQLTNLQNITPTNVNTESNRVTILSNTNEEVKAINFLPLQRELLYSSKLLSIAPSPYTHGLTNSTIYQSTIYNYDTSVPQSYNSSTTTNMPSPDIQSNNGNVRSSVTYKSNNEEKSNDNNNNNITCTSNKKAKQVFMNLRRIRSLSSNNSNNHNTNLKAKKDNNNTTTIVTDVHNDDNQSKEMLMNATDILTVTEEEQHSKLSTEDTSTLSKLTSYILSPQQTCIEIKSNEEENANTLLNVNRCNSNTTTEERYNKECLLPSQEQLEQSNHIDGNVCFHTYQSLIAERTANTAAANTLIAKSASITQNNTDEAAANQCKLNDSVSVQPMLYELCDRCRSEYRLERSVERISNKCKSRHNASAASLNAVLSILQSCEQQEKHERTKKKS